MRFSTSKIWIFLAGCTIAGAVWAPSIAATTSQAPQSSSAKLKPGMEATPAPITYNTIDGIWEVQLQPAGKMTIYSHFNLLTNIENVSGKWNRANVLTDLSGSQQGDHFLFNGSDAKGPFTLTGYIENSATMIGQLKQAGQTSAFTATHQGLPLSERPGKKHHEHHRHHKAESQNLNVEAPSPSP